MKNRVRTTVVRDDQPPQVKGSHTLERHVLTEIVEPRVEGGALRFVCIDRYLSVTTRTVTVDAIGVVHEVARQLIPSRRELPEQVPTPIAPPEPEEEPVPPDVVPGHPEHPVHPVHPEHPERPVKGEDTPDNEVEEPEVEEDLPRADGEQ